MSRSYAWMHAHDTAKSMTLCAQRNLQDARPKCKHPAQNACTLPTYRHSTSTQARSTSCTQTENKTDAQSKITVHLPPNSLPTKSLTLCKRAEIKLIHACKQTNNSTSCGRAKLKSKLIRRVQMQNSMDTQLLVSNDQTIVRTAHSSHRITSAGTWWHASEPKNSPHR